ncbi:MAG: Ig domain-containing protein [Ruminococcus sp.]|uniref:DUF6273 domain-containing protein n=1 Tax=Ruminococcus sp. TaxID=41978 RepID=UPI0025F24739|nr:DUF6273 domain-containing protein [Ruminococcus sp.]MBR0530679.1 Ig domain-containing protein [Ruminococcus sp.]
MNAIFRRTTTMLCAAAVMASSVALGEMSANVDGAWLFGWGGITANAEEYTDVSAFNSAVEAEPLLKLTKNVKTLVITRADGTIDLNGYTVEELFLRNNDPNKTVTVKNGTVKSKIDGTTGFDTWFKGKVVIENMTVLGNLWTDGHDYTIISGTYAAIRTSTNSVTTSVVTILDGTFNGDLMLENGGGSFIISGGYFKGALVKTADGEYSISDGTFKNKPNDDYIAEGSTLVQDENGEFVVFVNIAGVSLNENAITIDAGGNYSLQASVFPENATYKIVTWKSDDESVATVDENGVVTGVKAGTATITAAATNGTDDTADDKTVTCAVTVNKITDYTLTIPATFDIKNSGWNEIGDISASGTLKDGKKLVVSAESENGWALKSGKNSVGYTMKNAETDTAAADTWEFTDLPASHKIGVDVEEYRGKPAGNYTDTVTFTASVTSANPYAANSVGDEVTFGSYNWYIIKKSDNGVTLLMKDNLENKKYNDSNTDITWKDSSLRAYLNGEFYNSFSDDDKAKITLTHNTNPNNPEYDTSGGEETDDHIYLLSIAEAKALDSSIRASGSWWWLRSPGKNSSLAAFVIGDGNVYTRGGSVDIENGVRPALNLKF